MQEKKNYSLKKRLYIWWHYHWKILFAALAFLVLFIAVVYTQFRKKQPDYQIAVVSSDELPIDTQEALIRELKQYCSDVNNDGQVLIQLNSYRADFGEAAVDNDAYDQMSGTIKLYTDIKSDNGSYIFLLRDPQRFEETTRILQYLDGSTPESEEEVVNTSEMCYSWNQCPVLSSLSLGSYRGLTLMDNETGDSQDVMSDFYIARRILSTDSQNANHKNDEQLWQILTEGAVLTDTME